VPYSIKRVGCSWGWGVLTLQELYKFFRHGTMLLLPGHKVPVTEDADSFQRVVCNDEGVVGGH
jgi:hypothetical protein